MSAPTNGHGGDPGADEAALLRALRAGDEAAFVALVRRHTPAMTRVAAAHVADAAVADEVVQETWLSVLGGLDGFEGRSSLRTWIFTILVNCARRRSLREGRTVPFAALGGPDRDDEPLLPPGSFLDATHPRWPRAWAVPVDDWHAVPEERLLSREALGVVRTAIDRLPPAQRAVITLRDVEGRSAREACELLGVSDVHQRVLLHRARARVRREFAEYVGGE